MPPTKQTGMDRGKCYYCHESGEIAIKQWDGKQYQNCCTNCAKKYMDDQYVGMITRIDYPNIYYGKLKGKDETIIGVYHGPRGFQTIYGPKEARQRWDQ